MSLQSHWPPCTRRSVVLFCVTLFNYEGQRRRLCTTTSPRNKALELKLCGICVRQALGFSALCVRPAPSSCTPKHHRSLSSQDSGSASPPVFLSPGSWRAETTTTSCSRHPGPQRPPRCSCKWDPQSPQRAGSTGVVAGAQPLSPLRSGSSPRPDLDREGRAGPGLPPSQLLAP